MNLLTVIRLTNFDVLKPKNILNIDIAGLPDFGCSSSVSVDSVVSSILPANGPHIPGYSLHPNGNCFSSISSKITFNVFD